MTESDSGEGAMEEGSSNLMSKASDLLATPSPERLAVVVDHLFMRRETSKYQEERTLYDFCVVRFPNCLTRMLLKVYHQSSHNGVVRFRSISLLSDTLTKLRKRRFQFDPIAFPYIKPVLISCLEMPETKESDIKILRRIVSFVAYNVVRLDTDGWDELNDCILSMVNSEPRKAFLLFVDLPPVYGKFIQRVMMEILDKAKIVLLNPLQDRVQDWNLAFHTVVKTRVLVGVVETKTKINSEDRTELKRKIHRIVVKSGTKLMEKGMKDFMEGRIQDLKIFLARDGKLCKYRTKQREVVTKLAEKFVNCCIVEEESDKVEKIFIKVAKKHDKGSVFERDWYDHLKNLSSLEILRVFASSTDVEEKTRELSIRRLNLLLSDPTLKKYKQLDISVMRELQPLLISCLMEEGISESLFKVLGEVVYHVAYELQEDDTWYGLSDYIASKSKTEFQKAVYIFQCLAMPLDHDKFVIPVTQSLLPEIETRLNLNRQSEDNSYWVLAFAGGFCAGIHLIDMENQGESVKKIVVKMIDSVKELVVRGMEVGLVRRALRDVEIFVKKQPEWLGKSLSKYKLVKSLLWGLCEINGLKMESRMVLFRINIFVERGLSEQVRDVVKNLVKSDIDWLNQPEA